MDLSNKDDVWGGVIAKPEPTLTVEVSLKHVPSAIIHTNIVNIDQAENKTFMQLYTDDGRSFGYKWDHVKRFHVKGNR